MLLFRLPRNGGSKVATRVGAFEFEIGIHGARVTVGGKPVCAACGSDGEIDAAITRLKEDLDRLAAYMKSAVQAKEDSD
jgi:hypothetical protein